jgi:hypothetical protein
VSTNADRRDSSVLAATQLGIRFARALSTLYFIRTGVSLVWVLTVSAFASSVGSRTLPGALIETLLVLYPITDAAATFVDIRTTPKKS